jgi:hypothetical protein
MAEVPTIKVPQVKTEAYRPNYQSGNGATEAAFGGNQGRQLDIGGRAVMEASDALGRASLQIAERRNAVGRASAVTEFETWASEAWLGAQTEGDITDPAQVQAFGASLTAKAKEIAAKHNEGYGPASSEQLNSMLEGRRGDFMGNAASTAAEASQAVIAQTLSGSLSKYASQVTADPSSLQDNMAAWNREVDNYASALTPQQEAMYRKNGAAAFIGGTIDNTLYQPNGDLLVQKMLQSNPQLMDVFTVEQQEQIRQRIQVTANANAEQRNKVYTLSPGSKLVNGQGETIAYSPTIEKVERTPAQTALENLGTYTAITGKQPTEAMVAAALNVNAPSGGQTLADQVTDFNQAYALINGGAAPSKQVQTDFLNTAAGMPQDPARKLNELSAIREGLKLPPLSNTQVDALLGVKEDTTKTLAEKMAEAKKVVGEMSREEAAKLGGFFVAPVEQENNNTFGDSITGRTLDMFVQMAPAYATGQTTPDQDRQFEIAAWSYAMTPIGQDVNPYTKETTYRYRPLPLHVSQALEQRGVKWRLPSPGEPPPQPMLGDPNSAAPSSEPDPNDPAEMGDESTNAGPGDPAQPAMADVGPPTKANAQQQAQVADPAASRDAQQPAVQPDPMAGARTKNETLLELGARNTGPISGMAKQLHKIPGLGKGVGGEATQAGSDINALKNDLVRVLQNNPRYAEGERKQIMDEIDVSTKFVDDPQRYIDNVMGLRKSLLTRLENERKTAEVSDIGSEERVRAMNTVNAIENFLGVLTPPVFDSEEEARVWANQQEPGTPMVLKKGNTYQLGYSKKTGAAAPTGQ